ncbi:unnamed protein product [Notodromas monacha]|uniref:Uncharacterized protein n=1 Tax=Notodromas monacha TaxID=399045 RepID=A0A7R9BVU0_9CRUS|nr:unnamed protein product [Notodromas monacha]CAG0921162.1 unnamed protein product [Notodromas monacha]
MELSASVDVDQLDKMIRQLMKLKMEGEDHLCSLDKKMSVMDKQYRQRTMELQRHEKRLDEYTQTMHAMELSASVDVDQLDKMIRQLMKLKMEGEDHLCSLDKKMSVMDKQYRQRTMELQRHEKRLDEYTQTMHEREKDVERMTRRLEQLEEKLKEERERRAKLLEHRGALQRETENAFAVYKARTERIKYLRSRVSKISAEVEKFLCQGKDEMETVRRDSGLYENSTMNKTISPDSPF